MDADPYLQLAQSLFTRRLDEAELPAASATLPPLTEALLLSLGAEAERAGLAQPRRGWAVAAVAAAAAGRQEDMWLQAQAAWQLARAANRWVRPGRARRAALRAEALFAQLGQAGWRAAAVWQAHALPWAHHNFREVVRALAEARTALAAAGLEEWLPHCGRDLGYAYLLVGEKEKGLAEIVASEEAFRRRGETLEVGRSLVSKANALRRLGRFDTALETATEALALFSEEPRPFDYYVARFRQAAIQTLQGVAYDAAEAALLSVAEQCERADVPIWQAQSYSLLERLYRDTGRLAAAASALARAREIYRRFEVLGMQADNYLDSGRLAHLRGEEAQARAFYAQAQARYEQLQIPYMVAVAVMYQGDSYRALGRYQQALAFLEQAYARFEERGDDFRRAECALLLATTWLGIDQPQEALAQLEAATDYLEEAGRTYFLAELYAAQAEARFRLGQGEEALALLQQAAQTLPAGEQQPVHARLLRLQGEMLRALGRPEAALPLLRQAWRRQEEIGLPLSAAVTQVALGECYAELAQAEAARAAWEAALGASHGAEPEIAWRAHAGRARLAGDAAEKLAAYGEAVAALNRQRRWFWQPTIAGSYLSRPLALLDEAVALAARQEDAGQLLTFIEAGKAQTLRRQLALAQRAPAALAVAERPQALVSEIRWLQAQIEASVSETPGFLRPPAERRLRAQLRARLEAYERTFSARQRRGVGTLADTGASLPERFAVDAWRQRVGQVLGEGWVALDYYLAGDTVHGVLLTPQGIRSFSAGDPLAARALAVWARGRPGAQVLGGDRERLGRWLLPPALAELLTPETYLLLAPHKSLHHLPWPALPLADGRPLVAAAIPLLAPSLAVLDELGRRAPAGAAARDGLLLAVSAFAGRRHRALPEVRREVEALRAQLGEGSACLLEAEATWPALAQVAGANGPGLADFSFWHIATHAFHDALGGRLSGIALHERDLWLDELWELAPLPSLVVLSACNGSRGNFYPGDEQLGLVSTCLAAGARQVIGSLWPVLDPAAAALIRIFYRHLLAGTSAARALALAQREMLAAGRPLDEWAGFLATGTTG